MQQGYFTNRIKELEERKEQVTEEYVCAKLSLKGINEEIEKAFEYMNSAHYDGNMDISIFEKEILDLKSELKRKDVQIKKQSENINKQKKVIADLNKIVDSKESQLKSVKIEHHNELYDLNTANVELTEKIAYLTGKNNEMNETIRKFEKYNSLKSKNLDEAVSYAEDNNILKKENRELKRDIKALNERIDMMDKTIEKKNREIQILHERLNWQPINHGSNSEEIKEAAK